MIALDYTVFVQIVSFLFLWFLLNQLVFKLFLGVLEDRERRTEGVKAETASLIEEAERMRAEYENGIQKARDEGRSAKERVLYDARQQRENLLARAREEASRVLGAAREEVQKELRRSREFAAREAEAIARQLVERILGRRVG
jgi:F-type H+-transporting ATPase subunit b